MPKNEYESFFPFSKIRDQQKMAIEFAIDAFENGKKIVLLELPTGVGKSAIAITISRYLSRYYRFDMPELEPGSYILTTQKVLQSQYCNDFKELIRDIKSSSNYTCNYHAAYSCSEAQMLLKQLGKSAAGTEFEKTCKSACSYKLAKKDFIESPISVTNFAYYLTETEYGSGRNPNRIQKRKNLIIDECHNIEGELTRFASIKISEKFAKDFLGCKIPKLSSQTEVYEWVKNTYYKKLKEKIDILSKNVKNNDIDTLKKIASLENFETRVECFIGLGKYDSNYIMSVTREEEKRGTRVFEFKFIDVSHIVKNMFHTSKVLLMSATIVDKQQFCKSLGLDENDVAYMTVMSPFPKENRPILYIPTGNMSQSASYDVLVERVKQLLDMHKNEKGIIHTGNYKIANYLIEHIKDKRLLSHTSQNREIVLGEHIKSNKDTVLVSPSMTEGVDLRDDLSRFQIICKLPFPYLGDPVVKKRMQKDKDWYPYTTAKIIIQSVGRSIRNQDDHAITYIVDNDWEIFYRRNSKFFNSDFFVKKILQSQII